MASTLASQPLLRQRLGFCCRALSLYQRSIRHSHQGHGERPTGLTAGEIPGPGYQKTPSRPTWKKKVCLWKKGRMLGFMTMHEVMMHFLKPGKALSWRVSDEIPRPPDRESHATEGGKVETSTPARDKPKNDILHYDLISIAKSRSKPRDPIIRTLRKKGMLQVFLRSNTSLASGPGHYRLSNAYNILSNPETAAKYPVEFHIIPPENPGNPHGIQWALDNRVDLRPEVIMRAMPYRVRYTTAVQMRHDGEDAFFTLVTKRYESERTDPSKYKEQADSTGKANGPQAATGTQAQPSLALQMKFERAVKRKVQQVTAQINHKFQTNLKKAVKQRLEKFNGGPTTPLPEEISKMQRGKKAAIKKAIPEVREYVARGFGISIEPTGVAEDDTVDGSDGVPSPPVTSSTSS